MRKMKDSGIEWIGEIPESWTIERGKNIMQKLERPVLAEDGVITCFRDGEVTLRSNRREEGFTISTQETGYQGIEPGDLVVHGMDGFAGSIGISDSRGKATPVLNVLDSKENKKYLMYYMRSAAYCGLFLSLATGIRIRTCDTNWNKLKNVLYILPPLHEQQKISAYLDRQCSHIDNIIEKTKASVEEYKKLRQAVITQAVTKGVRGDRPMKDSGIEWIGEIPEKWHFIKITRMLADNHPYPMGDGDHGLVKTDDYRDEGIPYLRVQNLGWGTELLLNNVVYITEEKNEQIKNSTLRPNDILFAKTGATIGKTGIIPKSLPIANTTSHIGKITLSEKYFPRFVFYVLSSPIGYKQFWEIAIQKTTRPELSIDETRSIKVLIPDTYDEQEEIAVYLDEKCKSIDNIISKKEQFLTELEAYKKIPYLRIRHRQKGGTTGMITTEKRFESDIEAAMLSGGYTRNNDIYDAKNALYLDTLVRFVQTTQPKSWQRFEMQSGTPEKFAQVFQNAVDMDGLLSVMRNGFKHRGIPFRVCYFKPESGLNQTALDNYNANEITINRQWYYSPDCHKSVDMVIAVNGIPVFAFELKNQYTGQDIEDAKRQWMYDRDPKELCFRFNNRILAFFCVDHLEACMTTKLDGKNTFFLPFNQGSNGAGKKGGKGNPANPDGYLTAYLWENVFSRDSMMDILQKFMSYRKDKKLLLFPRYHQLDVVRSIISHVRENGAGHNYLIQHSAGSGKSNSIAWTAYRLAALFNNEDKPVFSSVIIVTDRRVLDAQLQETIAGFDHKLGAIETIDEKKTRKTSVTLLMTVCVLL